MHTDFLSREERKGDNGFEFQRNSIIQPGVAKHDLRRVKVQNNHQL
jgi:hypothetical protein